MSLVKVPVHRLTSLFGRHLPRTDSVGDQDDHAEAVYFTDKRAYILYN